MNKYITKINLREPAWETGESQTADAKGSIVNRIVDLYFSGDFDIINNLNDSILADVNEELRARLQNREPPINPHYTSFYNDDDLPF